MNKKELAKSISEQLKLSQKDCLDCINAITQIISRTLSRGEKVQISGFGKFYVKTQKEKMSYNPYTKRPILICAKNIPTFRSAKFFRENLR